MMANDVQLVCCPVGMAKLAIAKAHEVQKAKWDALKHVFEILCRFRGQIWRLVDLDKPWLQLAIQDKVKAVHAKEGSTAMLKKERLFS
jgi:hypothetical protein